MKLSIIFPVMNQHDLAYASIDMAMDNLSGENDVELVILDNGSDVPFEYPEVKKVYKRHKNLMESSPEDFTSGDSKEVRVSIMKYKKSIGVYPTFWKGLEYTDGDILAFFHSDLVISEKDWDMRVIREFEDRPTLGLLGFIGSNEIDGSGGRGLGTTSNFQGGELHSHNAIESRVWKGSPASVHGRVDSGFSNAVVVDGCAMIFRRETLKKIKQRPEFPPHHFYDRLLSCETIETGYTIGVLGIGSDHISGQTVNQEPKYQEMAKEWATAHGLTTMLMYGVSNWDGVIYKEAERQWLSEYRDQKRMIPMVIAYRV